MARPTLPTARDIMQPPETVRTDTDIQDAIRLLLRTGHSGAPVVDAAGMLQGVFSEHDCIRVLAATIAEDRPEGAVEHHMTRAVETVRPDEDLLVLATRFARARHRRLLVVEEGRLIGLISRSDLLRALEDVERRRTRTRSPSAWELIDQRHRRLD